MKRIIILAAFLLPIIIFGQNRGNPHNRESSPEQQELLMREKLKVIEVLELNEDVAVKFFARRQEIYEQSWKLRKQWRDTFLELEKEIKSGKKNDDSYYKKLSDKLLFLDREVAKVRQSFFYSLKKLLTPEQIAKYLIFEFRFRDEFRKALDKPKERTEK